LNDGGWLAWVERCSINLENYIAQLADGSGSFVIQYVCIREEFVLLADDAIRSEEA